MTNASIGRPLCRAALFAVASLILAACKSRSAPAPIESTSAPQAAASAYAGKLSPNEVKWGGNVVADSRVTYQDDVVTLSNGADAIHAMAPSGLGWSIDANAPGADRITVGKIMFVTGRAVGRVLKIERTANDLNVTLGPFEITELIKDCDLSAEVPVDLASAISYTVPDYPGAVTIIPQGADSGTAMRGSHDVMAVAVLSPAGEIIAGTPPRSRAPSGPSRGGWTARDRREFRAMHAAYTGYHPSPFASTDFFSGGNQAVDIQGFTLTPICCQGLGVMLAHDGADAKIEARAVIYFPKPTFYFELKIANGKINTATVNLGGSAGMRVSFDAGTTVGLQGNINANFFVPTDLSIPISGFGIPLAVTFRQTMVLTTAFTAKSAVITGVGEYEFHGALSMGFHNGSWGVSAPGGFAVKQSLLKTLSGASLGVNGITYAFGGKAIVGVGALGFIAGPYLGFNTVVGVTRGSDLSMGMTVPCRSLIFQQWMAVGVGYAIPQKVTAAINFFLKPLGVGEIKGEGGLEHKETLRDMKDAVPAGCDKPAE